MEKKLFVLLLILCYFTVARLSAQDQSMAAKDVKKLSKCELVIKNKRIPNGYLSQLTTDSLALFYNVQSDIKERSVFAKQTFALSNIDVAKVTTREKQLIFAGIGAIVLGATGYFLLYEDNSSTNLMGEEEKSNPFGGNGNAVLGGILGMGIGTSIGLVLSKKRINFKTDQEAAVTELRRWTD